MTGDAGTRRRTDEMAGVDQRSRGAADRLGDSLGGEGFLQDFQFGQAISAAPHGVAVISTALRPGRCSRMAAGTGAVTAGQAEIDDGQVHGRSRCGKGSGPSRDGA